MNEMHMKQCSRCTKVGILRLGEWLWVDPPVCFTPKPGLKITTENCPDCDNKPDEQKTS